MLGQHGARVAMVSRKEDNLRAAVDELRAEGIDARYEVADIRDAEAGQPGGGAAGGGLRAPRHRRQQRGGQLPGADLGLSPNGFKAVVDIDLLGTFNVTKAAFEAVAARAAVAHIVNISAPFEMKGASLQAHVAAAKAGVDSLTRTCAVEFGPYGIRVERGGAGAHRRHRGRASLRRGHRHRPWMGATGAPSNPLGIDGHGTDIAYTVLFLCSPAARFISGQVIAVDGGSSVDQLKMRSRPDLSRAPTEGEFHGGDRRGALHDRRGAWRRSCSTCRRSTSSVPTSSSGCSRCSTSSRRVRRQRGRCSAAPTPTSSSCTATSRCSSAMPPTEPVAATEPNVAAIAVPADPHRART